MVSDDHLASVLSAAAAAAITASIPGHPAYHV
jgi:hypothetical protein